MSTPIVPDPDSPRQLSLLDPVEIPLTKGFVAIVDPIDGDLAQFKWHAASSLQHPYAARAPGRRGHQEFMRLHRIILSRMLGRALGELEFADHINGNTLDNRRANLRLATRTDNNRNAKRRKDNPTGYKGVIYRKETRKWRASIRVDNRQINLGHFTSPEEAYRAYCDAARKYFGEFARIELPDDQPIAPDGA